MSKLIDFLNRIKCRHVACLFVMYLIFLPFQPWVIAEITTPIRKKMIEEDAIQIYVQPDEWRRLRGITSVATASTPPLEWYFLWEVEHSDIMFPQTIVFENRVYNARFIDPKTKILLYNNDETKERKRFGGCIFASRYYLYYDPLIHKIIASVRDVFALSPNYLSGGYNMADEDFNNQSRLRKFLQQNYNF
ncbi:hypothetical protein [Avibacterium paragallinarum]|uniref:HlyC family activation protein n=1 Tax=Avibacterium paragallinarum TaxID=728 RepID=I6QU27_AVIPA|nr:hypothetical protein [Avibacterium paragallinarum]AFM44710.1 HlyC family activation protein [Avibacterium paragallinarum]QJE10076.1 hypothetical protein HHJ62_07110 [Avibacterium paragallinarum]QJE12270.1 hypothetical protein HHJ61_07115 [Avibacterium paragallinarum]QJE14473.1 hypothetical protein HHJ60_07135 [Avibacterium paragallinarum]QJE16672.1 hypothetical protein HHJ59_07125 [Avibacterium paragallinarum]